MTNKNTLFLPNFCNIRSIFLVVMIGQLFAFILVLLPISPSSLNIWNNLSLVSLFVQWIGLSSCAIICVIRPRLGKLNHIQAGFVVYLLLMLTLGLISEAAYWLVYPFTLLDFPNWHASYLIRNLTVGAIIFALALRYFYVMHQWARNIKNESDARLEALQARIRPHFLFNSLNTIASLTRIDPTRAETATEDLADLFRATLKDSHTQISIKEEFDLCQRYLNIEKLRLADRLEVLWSVDAVPDDALVPPLSIQPIIENAIYHGVENNVASSVITLAGYLEHKTIYLTISNPTAPLSQFRNNIEKKHKGNNMAMNNIRERFSVFYGSKQAIKIEQDQHNKQYIVHFHFPYLTHNDEDTYS